MGKLGIKEETLTGVGKFQYSKIKVPAHDTCNNEFGSVYENKIINLLEDTDGLYDKLIKDDYGIPLKYSPEDSISMLVSTWMSKVYYGLFYNDFLKTKNSDWKLICKDIIDCDNFRMIQRSYKEGNGFCLPSSLYVFKAINKDFDLRTFVFPQGIVIKINSIILILNIGDGYLIRNYLNGEILADFRDTLIKEETKNNKFPTHLYALAEIMALRRCIPKSPQFIYSENEIINMSLSTAVKNPSEYYKIDEVELQEVKSEILLDFGLVVKD
ncbi:hypothetical protein [Aquimarina sp. I32.4]|uniref:hypothetical protein n=1 Tax=Aquimarina sp. I32.4 TaxID=2053903 RepID=UPI0018ED1FD9|nr:hypothetical protein [Aquimarina sp. I32.4]